jgi:tetratricopeptide (TPR) repeat protein
MDVEPKSYPIPAVLGKLSSARKTHLCEKTRFKFKKAMSKKSVLARLCSFLIAGLAGFALLSCSSHSVVQEEAAQQKQDKAAAIELIAQADKLYAERAELARAREGIVLLTRALAADSASYDAAWRLARLNYFLGAHTTDASERDKAYDKGVEAARRAVKLQDGKPEGHFWLGANLGGQAQHSAFSGMTSIDEIRDEMAKVIQLDEGFQGGSAYMALGQVDLEAPRMLGGDSKRAIEVLEKNLRFGETNALYRLRLAQAYLAVNRKEDARRELGAILNLTPNPDYLPEYNDAVNEARKLLDKTK